MSQIDPTDHALAAIASILDSPEVPREPQPPAVIAPDHVEDQNVREPVVQNLVVQDKIFDDKPLAPEIPDAGYFKLGPGPMAAIRFRWTVREDHGAFYMDETIGENSTAITAGPMTREEAIRLVDQRERDAQLRFEQLRDEMTGRASAGRLAHNGSGEM